MIKCIVLEKEIEKCLDIMIKIKEEIVLIMKLEDIIFRYFIIYYYYGYV